MNKFKKSVKMTLFSLIMIIGMAIVPIYTVEAELVQSTILNEGFENGFPIEGWTNSGWTKSLYGFAHSGSELAYSWANGDTLTTTSLTFGEKTELSFWYAAENAGNLMTLEVRIDETLVWNSTFSNTSYNQAVINLSSYTGDHTVSFIAKTSGTYGQLLDDIIVTTYTEEEPDPPSNGGGGGGDPPPVTPTNDPPQADASNGEPYQGFINETITFDGSLSNDTDGTIVNWSWDFGDDAIQYGEIVTHLYSEPGQYTVVLTVKDDDNAIDNYETTASIQQINNPPEKPAIQGLDHLQRDTNYTFTITSTDPNEDAIMYEIHWGDDTNTTIYADVNNTLINVTHAWANAGIYTIVVTASDIHNASSEEETMIVFVDITIELIDDDIKGYLIDYTDDGIFTSFYNHDTNRETATQYEGEGNYLIDADNNGVWEYTYNSNTGVTSYRDGKNDTEEPEDSTTPGFECIILVLSIILILYFKKRKNN